MITQEIREDWFNKTSFIIQYGTLIINEWESEFLSSIAGSLKQNKDLTFHQSKKLRGIYRKVVEKL